jgi:hypothetical protein
MMKLPATVLCRERYFPDLHRSIEEKGRSFIDRPFHFPETAAGRGKTKSRPEIRPA